jgi:ferredoxin-NADP reductase
MLIEPITLPSTKKLKTVFAIFTAFLYITPQMRISFLFLTPEMALVVGNIFSYIVSPRKRLALTLQEKKEISKNIFSFTFKSDKKFSFTPGQYLEWTLPHNNADSRGNRRYFSIASSPNEDIKLLVRYPKSPSSFKKELLQLPSQSKISAGQLSGDFTLPKNPITPMVFIAGGVGVAPFISMISFIVENKIKCDIVLIFINKKEEDITFEDLFEKAKPLGIKTYYLLTSENAISQKNNAIIGYLTLQKIREIIPDFGKRLFYISGPQLMVQNINSLLRKIGVSRWKIKQDFFPGYSENR